MKGVDKMRLFKKLIKIKGNGNQLISPQTKTNGLYKRSPIEIKGDNNVVKVDDYNHIYKLHLIISGNNNEINIGRDLKGILKIVINGNNIKVNIGNDCLFRGCDMAIFEHNSVLNFGNDSMAARDSRLYVSDFHTIYDVATKKPLNQGTHLNIGDHVWLGEGVIVLKNHTIADNVVVAAHSVVSRNLTESNAVYAGNPATLKKSGVNWDYRQYDEYAADYDAGKI